MTKVLLTGGSGFLGSFIKKRLLAHEAEVIAPRSSEMSLHDKDAIKAVLEKHKPEIIVHSAAYYGGLGICVKEPMKLFWYNIMMTANILAALEEVPVKKTVVVGSACSYPGDVDGDMKESEFWSGRLHPSVEPYGFTKKVNLVAQIAAQSQQGVPWAHPVITNLYGPGDVFNEYRSHVAAALIKKFTDAKLENRPFVELWGTGKPVREFLYVEDAAEAIAMCALTDFTGVVNIGTGIGTTIKELSEIISGHVGYQGEIRWDSTKPDGVMRKVLDVEIQKTQLKFKPKYSVSDGLKATIEWYLANKEEADKRQ